MHHPQDQFVHIWRYDGGYKAIDENMKFLQDNKDYNLIMKDMSPLLRSRESELYLQFSFWPEVALRSTKIPSIILIFLRRTYLPENPYEP